MLAYIFVCVRVSANCAFLSYFTFFLKSSYTGMTGERSFLHNLNRFARLYMEHYTMLFLIPVNSAVNSAWFEMHKKYESTGKYTTLKVCSDSFHGLQALDCTYLVKRSFPFRFLFIWNYTTRKCNATSVCLGECSSTNVSNDIVRCYQTLTPSYSSYCRSASFANRKGVLAYFQC